MWMLVPSRLPSAPKMLPRMPMAAGTSTNKPGSLSSVWVILPSVSPATRSPNDDTSSASNPWRAASTSSRTTRGSRVKKRRSACSRDIVGGSWVRVVAVEEPVPNAWLGDEPGMGGVVIELLAKLAGVDPQVLRFRAVLRAPHLLEDRPVG